MSVAAASAAPGAGTGATGYVTQMARVSFSSLVDTWILGGHDDEARDCAALAVQQRIWADALQRPRDYLPGLAARPVHDPGQFWFTSYLEEQYPQIRAEITQVLAGPADPVQPTLEDGWLTRSGSWQQAHLYRDGRWESAVCANFPVTTAILREIPELTTLSPGVIMISRLTPGTRIMPHCGSTNAVLRMHLPIVVPGGVSLRVGAEVLTWHEGKCLIFDDSYEHEVRHDGTADRVVLILDLPHPDLADARRQELLRRRPGPEQRIVAFMRERGLERLEMRGGELVFCPDGPTRELLTAYLNGAGAAAAEIHADQVTWQRRAAG
jgi:aspartate beta-hydroxylase